MEEEEKFSITPSEKEVILDALRCLGTFHLTHKEEDIRNILLAKFGPQT